MGKFVDLAGFRCGRLTVVERCGAKNHRALWLCLCDCGNTTVVLSSLLLSGKTKSCGCIRRENTIRMNKMEKSLPNGGPSRSHLYREWQYMKSRCGNKSKKGFHNYGGRGIVVCPEWKQDFFSFQSWALSNGYQKGLTLDRIDNNGSYSPDNCRWATSKEQANNRRTNYIVTINGETHSISEWSVITGISRSTLDYRIKHGWPQEKIFLSTNRDVL